MKKNFFIFVCVDAKKVGTWKQAEALAEKLVNKEYQKKPINLPNWCKWMPPQIFLILPKFIQRIAVKGLIHPLPDLIIAAGRQAVLVAIALRNITKTVVLMNPGVNPKYFDVVIAPEHDQITGDNVIVTQGALHSIDPSKLIFPKYLEEYPNPKVAVLLGGNSIHGNYENSLAKDLANDLKIICSHNATLIITPSRRTPLEWLEIFEQNLNGLRYWLWDQKSENPYPNLLSDVDTIIVCEDSISMASEACATGKPVLIYPTGLKKEKFKRFYQSLFDKGYAKPFSTKINISSSTKVPILNETHVVADKVKKILNL